MKLWQFGLVCVAVVLMCGLATHAWADAGVRSDLLSDGTVGCQLSKNLYQSTQDLIQGSVGLLVGLIMLLAGFWALINGAAILPSMATIIMGGLVTALPSLIISTMQGIGGLMSGDMGGAEYKPNVDCAAQPVCDGKKGEETCTTKNYFEYNGQIYKVLQ